MDIDGSTLSIQNYRQGIRSLRDLKSSFQRQDDARATPNAVPGPTWRPSSAKTSFQGQLGPTGATKTPFQGQLGPAGATKTPFQGQLGPVDP